MWLNTWLLESQSSIKAWENWRMRQEDPLEKWRGTEGTWRKDISQQRREMKAMTKEDLRCNSYAKREKSQQEKSLACYPLVI